MKPQPPHSRQSRQRPTTKVATTKKKTSSKKSTAATSKLRSETEVTILAGEYGEELKRLLRERHKQRLTPDQLSRIERDKLKLKGTMLILSISLLLVATAFDGLRSLQTTVNADRNLGALSLAILYIGSFASCLFLPSYFLLRLGCKGTILVCIGVCSVYMMANFKPSWYAIFPASLIYGIFLAPLEAAKDSYITETGIEYATLNYEFPTDVITRFFGYFFGIQSLGQLIGNLISSMLLFAMTPTTPSPQDHIDRTCGSYSTPHGRLSEDARVNLQTPHSRCLSSLCGVFFCCQVVAFILIASCISRLHMDKATRRTLFQNVSIWRETVKHLKTPKHIILIPLTIYNGLEKAFILGLYTKSFVGCCLGIQSIGYVIAMFGLCSAMCSVLFGPLFKLFGRFPLFLFASVVNALIIFTLLIWPPNPGDHAFFYVAAASWGTADGVWNTQMSVLYADLFEQELQTAFANHRLFESIGYITGFLAIPYTGTRMCLYLLFATLVMGIVGYGMAEVSCDITGFGFESIGYITGFLAIPYTGTRMCLYLLFATLVMGIVGYGMAEVSCEITGPSRTALVKRMMAKARNQEIAEANERKRLEQKKKQFANPSVSDQGILLRDENAFDPRKDVTL